MHAHELVSLAAQVAYHAPLLVQSGHTFPDAALQSYWTAARCRHEIWLLAVKQFLDEQREAVSFPLPEDLWIRPVLEEVLVSEVLTRVWGAVSALAETTTKGGSAESIARSVLECHQEARQRVLQLMVRGYGMRIEDAVTLNRLRLRHERCTDSLLALVGPAAARVRWSFHPREVRRLAVSFNKQPSLLRRNLARSLVVSAVTAMAPRRSSMCPPNAELNRRLACSVLACFPPHVFDSTGLLMTSRQLEMFLTKPDRQGRLKSLRTPADGADLLSAETLPNTPPRRFMLP